MMPLIRGILFGLGAFAVPIGLMWIGQGLGILHWPRYSPMIGQNQWALNGFGLLVFGALSLFLAWRLQSGGRRRSGSSGGAGKSGRRRRTKR